MATRIKYSLLVPVYNVEKYLSRCLDSLLNQTYHNYEIIICNDNSSDCSSEICERYKNKYPEKIRVFHNSKNVGLYKNRFILFGMARGEYIICVDSDDYVSSKLLEEIERTTNRYNCDVVIYDYYAEYQFRCGLTRRLKISYSDRDKVFDENNKKDFYMDITTGSLNSVWRKAFKRELINDNDYVKEFEKMSIGEDLLLSLPIVSNAKKIVYINAPLYYYRRNLNSLTRNAYLENKIKCMLKVLNVLEDKAGQWQLSDKESLYIYYCKTIESFIRQISYEYKQNGMEKTVEMFQLLAEDENYYKVLANTSNAPLSLRLLENKNYEEICRMYRLSRIKQKLKNIVEMIVFP